ncbi:MAG: beta-lactamase family protein [Candidatus Hydrogenedentes bacterium]|nr:beta-lactamase family protein [Candidatus Hydrogenedentota bacterium]
MSTELTRREALMAGAGGVLAAAPSTQPRREPMSVPPLAPRVEETFALVGPLVTELLARSGTPGLSLAIIRNREIAYAKGFGLANVATNSPVTPETVFQAASLTKPVFTYAALKLCDSGRMGLDTPLVTYIPHARVSREPRAHRITPRMVMAHTSGLPNFGSKRPLRMDFDPGAHFAYSGEAFNVLQEAVEAQSEQPLNTLLTDAIIKPFGLSDSALTWIDAFDTSAAIGYEWDGAPVKSPSRPSEAMAASSLHTTARDYAAFMLASLGHAKRGPEHLEYATERIMLSPQVHLSGPLAWGLGWALLLRDEGDIHWHIGDSRGYMSYAAMCRATGDGVAIFTNSRHGLRVCHAVAKELLDEQDEIFQWVYDVFYEGKLPEWQAV